MKKSFWRVAGKTSKGHIFNLLRFLQILKITKEEANDLWRYEVQGFKREK